MLLYTVYNISTSINRDFHSQQGTWREVLFTFRWIYSPRYGETNHGGWGRPPSDGLERDTLTGDWGGSRTWLQEHGITLKPRLTQFYQGLTEGDGDHGFEYGGKADILSVPTEAATP